MIMKRYSSNFLPLFLSVILLFSAVDKNFAETHYVTQQGTGLHDGTYGNEWSVSEFNNSSNWDTDVADDGIIGPGDTIYFMETITSEIDPQGDGVEGYPIVIRGDYPGREGIFNHVVDYAGTYTFDLGTREYIKLYNETTRAVIDNQNVVGGTCQDNNCKDNPGTYGISINNGLHSIGAVNVANSSNITIDNWEIKNGYIGIIGNSASYLTITRCYINTMAQNGANIVYSDHIIIGGSSENGNEFYRCGFKTLYGSNELGADAYIVGSSDIIVSYNEMHGTTGAMYDGWGFSGILLYSMDRAVVEYNTIHDQGARNSRGAIHLKGQSSTKGTDLIIRYNNIYNGVADDLWGYTNHPGITVSRNMIKAMIYGNRIENCNAGISVSVAQSYCHECVDGYPTKDLYIWGNQISNSNFFGIWLQHGDATCTDDIANLFVFNNSIYKTLIHTDNGTEWVSPTVFTVGLRSVSFDDGTYPNPVVTARNNIFTEGRYGQDNQFEVAVYYKELNGGPEYIDIRDNLWYNTNYVNDFGVHFSYDCDCDNNTCTYSDRLTNDIPDGWLTNETVDNPDFTDQSTGNLTLRTSSAAINNGEDLSSDIIIPSISFPFYSEDTLTFEPNLLLHPLTDWTTIPPTIITANQSDFGSAWEQGAYVYDEDALPAPTDLTDTLLSFTATKLFWEDNSTDEDGFIIQCSETGFNYVNIDTVGADVTNFTNTGLTPSSLYYYRVCAYNSEGKSGYSNFVLVKTEISAPTDLAATIISFTEIELEWTDNSTIEEGYIIQRSTDSVTFGAIDTVETNITTYLDSGLSDTIKYHYRVFGYNSEGQSDFSNSVSAQPGITKPSELYAETQSSSEINLYWTDNSVNEDGFVIQRCENGVDFISIDSVDMDTVRYFDTGLTASTIYHYRIFAFNGNGVSGYSNVILKRTESDTSIVQEPLFNWNMESGNILLDEGTAKQDLTNNGSVTTGGLEPNPPGYGSVGAIFDGSSQYLSLSNDDYGDRALNGTDTDGTIYIAFNADAVDGMPYMWSKYTATAGNRQLSISFNNNLLRFNWGYNNGASYVDVALGDLDPLGKDIILGLSLDALEKKFIFTAKDLSTGTYYTKTEADETLPGTYNTGTAAMTIGSRSDGASNRSFDGTVYWARIYDEAHTLENIKAVIEGTITGLDELQASDYGVLQNYPNPFSNETTISFSVTMPSLVSLDIYNILGEKVKSLANKKVSIGNHSVIWDGCNDSGDKLPYGTYFCTIKLDGNMLMSKKLILLK